MQVGTRKIGKRIHVYVAVPLSGYQIKEGTCLACVYGEKVNKHICEKG